ncbi:MAG: lipopolysaccharide biosynthesis protein [Bacteroidaceae bacterium]|nr:lipopolysaccharide biosynthesis protein [Bacteroidaceae bacterium]
MAESSLKERTARGLLWGGMSNGIMQLLGALFGLALMRLLTPADWGKVYMLNIFAVLASTLQESGFIAALCNKKEPTDKEYNAVFWFNMMVSGALYIILWFLAPYIASFYNDPDLTYLARFLFLGFLLSGLGTVQRAYLFGHLMVRETSICGIVAMLVSGIVGVTMAWMGFAHWGIVSQSVSFVFVVQLMNWYYSSWRPSLHIDLRPAWQMFKFSSKLLVTNIFNILNNHAFSVLLGKYFGDRQAGVYGTARKWDDMAASTINGMLVGVAQPTLTQVIDDKGRYVMIFRKMLRFISFVSFPALLGLGMIAQEFILIAGGEKWAESGRILSMLCVHGAFFPLTTLYSNLTISRGHSGVNMACTIGQCLAVWTGLILLYVNGYGMVPMVIFFIVLNVLWLGIWQWWAKRLIGLKWHWVAMDTMPFLLFTLLVLSVTWWMTRSITSLWPLMLTRIALAVALYAGIMWISGAKIMREAIGYILNRKKRS